jgi:DNA-binding response OmpR family regulator
MSNFDVVLIEDSVTQALHYMLLLQQAGYSVHVARDGIDGLLSTRAHRPRLVLLDVALPALDGFHVLACIKSHRATAQIPVVVLTSSEKRSDIARIRDLGGAYYLHKRQAAAQLIGIVNYVLTGTTPLPECLTSEDPGAPAWA